MKKIVFCFCLLTIACTTKKEKIANRQKEILQQKAAIEQLLETTKDSSMPTAADMKKWDSLYHAEDSLNTLYDSLRKQAKQMDSIASGKK